MAMTDDKTVNKHILLFLLVSIPTEILGNGSDLK